MEIKLDINTSRELNEEEKELLKANIWALLNEVRPDLVIENIDAEIEHIEVN